MKIKSKNINFFEDQSQYLTTLEKDLAVKIIEENLYQKDPTFKELVSKLVPPIIYQENEGFIDGFIDSLVNLSPVSVNISDIFHKYSTQYDPIFSNPEKNKIKGIQDKMNKTFLFDFWDIFDRYSKDYIIKQRMEDYIHGYSLLGNIDFSMDFEFFNNVDSLYTEDRFLTGNEFFIKKGTALSIEYAYKSAWKAKVEGVFRESYSFDLNDETTTADVTEGCCINPEDPSFSPNPNWNPLPPGYFIPPTGFPDQEPFCDDGTTCSCTDPGKAIGTWVISTAIGGNVDTKRTFYYEVIGSMLPIFFNTIVKDLAHPVGFEYDYRREFATLWNDYFNLSMEVRADTVMVKTLCTNGDCSNPTIDYYATSDGSPSITDSYLIQIIQEDNTYGPFLDYKVSKYLFENGQFLLEYVTDIQESDSVTGYKTFIEYFDNDFTNFHNYVLNPDFDSGSDWSRGDRWTISDGKAILDTAGSNDILSQSFTFYSKTRYVFEINIIKLEGEINLKFGTEYEKKITSAGKHIIRFYNANYYDGDLIIEDGLGNGGTYCEIDYINGYKDTPKKVYDSVEHSNVLLERFTRLPPIVTTKEEFALNYNHSFEDSLNIDLGKTPSSKYPIIGDNISIGFSGSSNSLYSFIIGCYDPNEGVVYPPYTSLDGCCQANIPYTPGGSCIYGQLILNNPELAYLADSLYIESDTQREKIPLVNQQGFDSNWTIVSGNATIVDGILSQDGSEESVVERILDNCPIDYDIFYTTYVPGRTGTGNTVKFEYINYDGTSLSSTELGINIYEWAWLIQNSSCDDINKVKLRITLPVGYTIPMSGIEIYKY